MSKRSREESVDISSSKKAKHQNFLPQHAEKWKFLRLSKKGPTYAFCMVCNSDFSCAHGGRNDFEKHLSTNIHKRLVDAQKGVPSSQGVFSKQSLGAGEILHQQAASAEICMVRFIVDSNLPLSSADSMTGMFQQMFPDTKIAKGISRDFVMDKPQSTLVVSLDLPLLISGSESTETTSVAST